MPRIDHGVAYFHRLPKIHTLVSFSHETKRRSDEIRNNHSLIFTRRKIWEQDKKAIVRWKEDAGVNVELWWGRRERQRQSLWTKPVPNLFPSVDGFVGVFRLVWVAGIDGRSRDCAWLHGRWRHGGDGRRCRNCHHGLRLVGERGHWS